MFAATALLLGIVSSMPTGDIWKQLVIENFDDISHAKAFQAWQREYNKKYTNLTVEGHHFIQFIKNWRMINEHNKKFIENKETYSMGLNQFGDLSFDEFRVYVHGKEGSCMKSRPDGMHHISIAEKIEEHKKKIMKKLNNKKNIYSRIKNIKKVPYYKKNSLDNIFDNFNKEFNNEFNLFENNKLFVENKNEIDFNIAGFKGKFEFDIETYNRRLKEIGVPSAIDWTNMNGSSYVTPVKNQGQCGSCWAFSTTGSIESRSAIKNGWTGKEIPSLSEQQLVDCSRAEGNDGCNGGLMVDGFKYVEKEGGLCTESEYHYTARDGACKASTCGKKYDPITGYKMVQRDSSTSLETDVAQGPVSVSVDAAGTAWQFYKSGVLTSRCGTSLDHGVLAVGYGYDSQQKQQYWKVKNSWGESWGEKGYIRICRNCNKNGNAGECGILKDDSYPTV